jgi:peptide deformylase
MKNLKTGKILPIRTYPDPVLLQPSTEVFFPLSPQTQNLIQDMWATVNGQGIGLAAPQVGVSQKILIIKLSDDFSPKDLKKMGINKNADFLMINPEITWFSELESLMIEGCLSFPNQYYEIWRPANIKVQFFDEQGKKQNLTAKDWLSRVIQHEVDHLNGQIFINKGGTKIEDEKQIGQRRVID